MTDEQINEIMELVTKCMAMVATGRMEQAVDKRAAIESALRAVPAIPEGLIDALNEAADNLSNDAREPLGDELHGFALMLSASPQAPQPAQPRKPLFEDLIAQHPGLSEELSAMDAQPDWTGQTR